MKLICALITLFVLGASAQSSPRTRQSCSAFGAIKIRLVGSGRCRGVAGAACKAITTAIDDIEEAYDAWYNDNNECQAAKIEQVAKAVATAVAEVYVATLAKVKCVGKGGFACGYAISEGRGFAFAVAKAIAQAAVDVSSVDSDAFCISDVEAVAGAIAEAAASAQSAACVEGTGSETDFQFAFVKAVQQALASAYAKATAATCDAQGQAAAASLCFGEAEGKTKGQVKRGATPGATASGTITEAEVCGKGFDACCAPGFKKPICKCKSPCTGTYIRIKQKKDVDVVAWKRGKEICLCKN